MSKRTTLKKRAIRKLKKLIALLDEQQMIALKQKLEKDMDESAIKR
jgi:hypothetical protein